MGADVFTLQVSKANDRKTPSSIIEVFTSTLVESSFQFGRYTLPSFVRVSASITTLVTLYLASPPSSSIFFNQHQIAQYVSVLLV
jgi:hypothetical protein